MTKAKLTPHDAKAMLRSVAILECLKDKFYDKYPSGIAALATIESLFDADSEEVLFDAAASDAIEEAVSDLLRIVEKYK